MIGIVDYGMGNLGSVSNACAFLGLPAQVITRPEEMAGCRAVIMPGVGAFGDCMRNLNKAGFVEPVKQWIASDRPFLGICLGLQVLYAASEESPGVAGLGILPGTVTRFRLPPEWKVPQIGWNAVGQRRSDCPLFQAVPDQQYFYFVHSYYAPLAGADWDAGVTSYGLDYVSAVWRGRMFAVQFHPEKSQKMGLQILKNFAALEGKA
jgi:glutamine amidotransferase